MNTNNMFSFLLGAATGIVGGIAVKDKVLTSSSKDGQMTLRMNELTEDNNSLKSKNVELERRFSDAKKEIEMLKSKLLHSENKGEDDEDAIFDLQKANKKLLAEKESLASELTEIKSLLAMRDQEINELNDKIFQIANK